MRRFMMVFLLAGFCCPVIAEEVQANRMKVCNADAARQELKGDARKQFMKDCLSTKKSAIKETKKKSVEENEDPAPVNKDRKLTAQQKRMQDCNAEAKPQSLKRDAYRQFMKECLSRR